MIVLGLGLYAMAISACRRLYCSDLFDLVFWIRVRRNPPEPWDPSDSALFAQAIGAVIGGILRIAVLVLGALVVWNSAG